MKWYEELFATEAPARIGKYAESDASRAEVDFVIERLGLCPGARILDLCCGQGRHLLEMVRRGYDVLGVDLSEYMLSKCREAAALEGIEPMLLRRDMREIDFDSEFDAVICMLTSFGYLESDDEDQKVLDALATALKPHGSLLFDLANPVWVIRSYAPRGSARNARGEVTTKEKRYDPVTGRMHGTETTTLLNGDTCERCHITRLYTYPEITRMLRQAGLEPERVAGGFDGSDYSQDSEKMIVVACKAG